MANDGVAGLSEKLIRCAYRVLLGREHESDSVVSDIERRTGGDPEAILATFVRAPEFQARHTNSPGGDFARIIHEGFIAQRGPVDTDVPPAVLEAMFARIRQQWKELGENEPHWSVFTDEMFRRGSFSQNAERFYSSGKDHAAMVDYIPARNGVAPRMGRCLELGCGVGRITRFLSERFDEVMAVDISPGNLTICENYLTENGVTNVRFRLLESPRDLSKMEMFDFFFSVIVLQHNPPPVQKYLLEQIMAHISLGGCALCQLPTFHAGYWFDSQEYLRSPSPPNMEMHVLPMVTVLSVLRRYGLAVKEVVMDGFTGMYGSHTFFAQKAAYSPCGNIGGTGCPEE
jgi:2-polyprenyl-3-methyl-5-hydroxy-6-metoxy-1,4-benzoquinol methylase